MDRRQAATGGGVRVRARAGFKTIGFALATAAALAFPAFAAKAPEPRVFVGYYPSWMDAAADCGAASRLACVSRPITHVIVAFADPHFTWNGDMSSWSGSGLGFKAAPADVKAAIAVLHGRGLKVLLAVGGQTYLDWTALAAEGNGNTAGPITKALAHAVSQLGFDGLDVDDEQDGADASAIRTYRGAVLALRRAADLAGRNKLVALAAWSTGADCTPATGLAPCGGKASVWQGRAGRERLLFSDKDVVAQIDMVSVMSYDAGTAGYDAVRAFALYRDLLPARIIVNIGFETAPQGWGDATLVAHDADARCGGARVKADQFGTAVNRPYSVEGLLRAGPLTWRTTTNPRDGAMLWHLLKTQSLPMCGEKPAASPADIERAAAPFLAVEGRHVR